MSTFILVHGAWHGGWVWDRVAQQLKRSGHNVLAPDLPAHGSDRTPVGQVTLQRYVDKIVNLVDACAQPVVLAGHSMGGIVLSQAAEQRPERIRVLVYICAFMLRNGQTLLEVAQADKDALVMPNVILTPDGSSANLQPEILREMFYGTCSDNDFEFAKSRLVPQPSAPFGTPLQVSEANFGRVPRLYIECLRDRAITIACQREMQARAGRDRVETLDCDHSPFFSATDELVKFLLSADGMSIRGNASIRHQGAPH